MSESMAEVDDRAAAAATGDAGRARSLAEGGQQPPAVKGGATISASVVLLAVLAASVAALLMSSVPRAGDGDGEGAVGSGMQGAGAGAGEEAAPQRWGSAPSPSSTRSATLASRGSTAAWTRSARGRG